MSKKMKEVFDQWIKPMLYLEYQYYAQKNVLHIQ